MREQLKLLEELQRRDAHLQELEASRKALPEKMQSLKQNLVRMEALLQKEREGLADIEKFRREQETQLKIEEANITKAKAKQSQVRGGKEYSAAQRELEATRRTVSEREEEILKLIEAIDKSRKAIAAHEEDVARLREHVAQEEIPAMKELERIEREAAEDKRERELIAAKVEPELLKKYGTIRMRRGLALAPVVQGVCQGCHMAIPPQLYNVLQRADSVETCPNCHRLVYWDQVFKDEELEREEASS
ncbi:MAG: C4-type zinc ribbon domain-containing protein [Pseudomonadota bacterium]